MKKMLALLAVAAALCLSADSLFAQNNGGGNGGGGGGGGRRNGGGGGNFDPAAFQQRMMDNVRDRLGFTNDTDWSAVEPLVQKTFDARRDVMAGQFRGFGRGGRGGQGGGGGGGGQGGPGGGQTNPDAEALQQALDSNAPAAQVKTLLDKYRASQKAKQAKLEEAQADLRKVLSQKQEAEAVLLGLLN